MKVFKWFTDTANLLIQVVVVVAVVLIFSFIDPFGIFTVEKIKLKHTPVDVESIKEIGELITAEYYGEVVSSYNYVIEQEQQLVDSTFEEETDELLDEFIEIMDSVRSKKPKLKKRNAYSEYLKHSAEITELPNYHEFLLYFQKTLKGKKYKEKHLDKEASNRKEEWIVKKLFDLKDSEYKKIKDNASFMSKMETVFKERNAEEVADHLKNRQLVLLGRGWVKAGYDLSSISNKNFFYDDNLGLIYLKGFTPEILTVNMNPWFIPEEEVPGFEFLVYSRGTKRDPELLKRVKQDCMLKLEAKAHKREILEHARTSAQEQLIDLFSLLSGTQIKDVVLTQDPYLFAHAGIRYDSIISGEELSLIDSLYIPNVADTASIELQEFCQEIDSMIVDLGDSLKLPYRYKSTSTIYSLVKDGKFTTKELEQIANSKFEAEETKYLNWKKEQFGIRDKEEEGEKQEETGEVNEEEPV